MPFINLNFPSSSGAKKSSDKWHFDHFTNILWVLNLPLNTIQFKCYSQWRMKAIFSVKMLWFMINNKWIEKNWNNHRVNLCLDTYFYLHCGFCPKHIFDTARKPNLKVKKFGRDPKCDRDWVKTSQNESKPIKTSQTELTRVKTRKTKKTKCPNIEGK